MKSEPAAPDGQATTERLTVWLRGHVQGVGMRWWVRSVALEHGLVGSATNLDDGRVEIVAQGPRWQLERLLADLRAGSGPGRVDSIVERWSDARAGLRGFVERTQ